MAFGSASGYTNLPNGLFVPTLYSKKVQLRFRKDSVAEAVTNNEYFGEIKSFGDTVRIMKEPEIEITPYLRGSQLTSQDLEDDDFTLTIDRANRFQFQLDDLEKHQSHIEWENLAANRAAYKMKDTFDADILGYMSGYEKVWPATTWTARSASVGEKANDDADSDELLAANKLARDDFVSGGSSSDSVAVGVQGTFDATPLAILNKINLRLDLNNVPKEDRFIVIDPVFTSILMDENSKFINNDYNPGADQLTNGKLIEGKIRGFKVYESNNLPYIGTGPGTADTNGSSAHYGVIVAGHKGAVATAQQLDKVENFRSPLTFADVVRGLHLYGRKILRPESLVRCIYNINQ